LVLTVTFDPKSNLDVSLHNETTHILIKKIKINTETQVFKIDDYSVTSSEGNYFTFVKNVAIAKSLMLTFFTYTLACPPSVQDLLNQLSDDLSDD